MDAGGNPGELKERPGTCGENGVGGGEKRKMNTCRKTYTAGLSSNV